MLILSEKEIWRDYNLKQFELISLDEVINISDASFITDNFGLVQNSATSENVTFTLDNFLHRTSPMSGTVEIMNSPDYNYVNLNNSTSHVTELQQMGLVQYSYNNLEPEDAIYITDSPESPTFICIACDLSFSMEEQLESHNKLHATNVNPDEQTIVISKIGQLRVR